jgi:DNA (cytosine-5)-methyltransferase 1
MGEGQLDILDGSPPCVQFSQANYNPRLGEVIKNGGILQRTDDLFFEFIRILRQIKPRTFVVENVTGLRKGEKKKLYDEIMWEFYNSGYLTYCEKLEASALGVPQRRSRLIFIGVRMDLGLEPTYPKNLPHIYTTRQVLPHLIDAYEDTGGNWGRSNFIDRPSPVIRPSGRTHLHVVDKSNPTVTRKITVDELKKLCSFPDDFKTVGSYTAMYTGFGNAVPPLMMYHIAKNIQENILDKLKEKK